MPTKKEKRTVVCAFSYCTHNLGCSGPYQAYVKKGIRRRVYRTYCFVAALFLLGDGLHFHEAEQWNAVTFEERKLSDSGCSRSTA